MASVRFGAGHWYGTFRVAVEIPLRWVMVRHGYLWGPISAFLAFCKSAQHSGSFTNETVDTENSSQCRFVNGKRVHCLRTCTFGTFSFGRPTQSGMFETALLLIVWSYSDSNAMIWLVTVDIFVFHTFRSSISFVQNVYISLMAISKFRTVSHSSCNKWQKLWKSVKAMRKKHWRRKKNLIQSNQKKAKKKEQKTQTCKNNVISKRQNRLAYFLYCDSGKHSKKKKTID